MRRVAKASKGSGRAKRGPRPRASEGGPEASLLARLQQVAGNQAVNSMLGEPVQRQAEKLPWPEWGPSKKAKALAAFDSEVAARLAAARKALAAGKVAVAMDSLKGASDGAAALGKQLPKGGAPYFAMGALVEHLKKIGALLLPHLGEEKSPLAKIAAALSEARITEARKALAE